MTFVISIKDVIQEYPDNSRILEQVLNNMAEFQKTGFRLESGDLKSYKYYAQLDFGIASSRTAIGNALGDLWRFCYDNEIPLLNLLVVRQDNQLPGDGIYNWYIEHYNTLKDYDKYCKIHASLAELMLTNGCIQIIK